MKPLGKILVLLSTFISGFIIMGFEIFASRVFRPYFGGGTQVWGALISVFLAGLSTGYILGGIYVDKNSNTRRLGNIMLASGVLLLLFRLYANTICESISAIDIKAGYQALISACIIFYIPSVLIGMMTPFFIKLNVSSLESVGESSGGIFALSTFGSIIGTIVSSFFLVTIMSTSHAISLFGIILFINGMVWRIIPNEKFCVLKQNKLSENK